MTRAEARARAGAGAAAGARAGGWGLGAGDRRPGAAAWEPKVWARYMREGVSRAKLEDGYG